MNSFEEEKTYWQNLLDKGEINLETYNRQMKIIEQRAKISGKKIEKYYVDLDITFTLDRDRNK